MARRSATQKTSTERALPKARSGIQGLDEITNGGLPRGRPTLICGSAGCGKTLFAMEFLARGATEFGENGVFMSFEETGEDLAANVASIGFDLPALEKKGKLLIDYVRVVRSEIEETGEYDLEGLFVRLQMAVETVGAKRVVLDTLEALFGSLDPAILRAELRRLFEWLKARGLTAVITAERGEKSLTRHGLEEYISDCVILLDHRVNEEVSTRRLRVVKYRGSTHGTNEYPFLIDATGFSVLPVTSMRLDHQASRQRISTGIVRLDQMLGAKGYFRGSSILVSGTAGAGKTSLSASLVRAACQRGERCLYFAYEESVSQLARNMDSIGVELAPYLEKKLLHVESTRPYQFGLEMHLVLLHQLVRELKPKVLVIDPVTNLSMNGTFAESRSVLTRIIDFLKNQGITSCFTSLTDPHQPSENSEVGISSLIDTWIALRSVESGGERNRLITIIKSRGMSHSNQSSEFLITSKGVQILDAYLGPAGVLTGAARLAQEAREAASVARDDHDLLHKRSLLRSRRAMVDAQIQQLKTEYEAQANALKREIDEAAGLTGRALTDRDAMAKKRWAFSPGIREQR